MSETITIELPMPDGSMSGHAKGHWRKKASATKTMRYQACVLAMATGKVPKEPWTQARIDYAFFLASDRRTDEANLIQRCKPYVDGIVDAGIILDDNWRALKTGSIVVSVDRKNPRVEITITKEAS